MTKTVLIITHSGDLHADLLSQTLIFKGCHPFRLNLDCFPRDYQLSQIFLPGHWHSEITHIVSSQCLDLAQVGAVWLRKPADYTFLSQDLTPQERAYAKLETEQALFSLLYCLNCYWVSHPLALRAALWKGEQLQRAMRMGFRIPASLITNVPAQVHSFRQAIHSELIFKSMSTPTLAVDEVEAEDRISYGICTTILTDDYLDDLDSVSELASHFQEYIPKQYELRVTVIGEKLFAAKIHSQDDARTAIDSRDMSAEILYEATQLPPDIAQRCLNLVKSYGLNFSAIDLIVTPDNEYVFLENNPNGQFLYIQQLIPEFKLLETLADTLILEAQCHNQ
ncbi:MAG: MvdC/MvdD family ATP grasp protein [Acidobacteriota bacterium]